ncbi:hypothetical protein BKA59DRAFT_495905 [Fusarium tricinctum]|uniref:Uncharacterized protein n=1 Tax=Fusarium tricinctum TaxID=61284 RepID=A0A8K0RSQ2_9HYPO|nr:hypothetical protein BKA59DRAFT_495905 [Fusarium tricinctum]
MLQTTSSFIKSSIPFYHNAIKSLVFKCAELLTGIFVYKLFSLIAARLNQFTSYLIVLNILLSLYGTLLWALDTPGYILRIIGSDLFLPELNYTLTGLVINSHGMPEVILHASAIWNSIFSNLFARDFVVTVAGKPEVYWDNESDNKFDLRYITLNKEDNIWFSFGDGVGSALMKQVFTVTKGRKRHTFINSILKVTMLTTPGVPFINSEVTDLVERTWSTDIVKTSALLIGRITKSIINTQTQGMSYHFGGNILHNGNKSNEAFGGKLMRIDCVGNLESADLRFFGQVDTVAVIVAHGLGDSRSNISLESLNNDALNWSQNISETIDLLLIARAFIVSINSSLVQIAVNKLVVAISHLQLALSCLALLMAIVLWLIQFILADTYWASSFLANLIYTILDMSSTKPRYITGDPRITLQSVGKKKLLAVDGKIVTLTSPALT